jgi:hypothetical protein
MRRIGCLKSCEKCTNWGANGAWYPSIWQTPLLGSSAFAKPSGAASSHRMKCLSSPGRSMMKPMNTSATRCGCCSRGRRGLEHRRRGPSGRPARDVCGVIDQNHGTRAHSECSGIAPAMRVADEARCAADLHSAYGVRVSMTGTRQLGNIRLIIGEQADASADVRLHCRRHGVQVRCRSIKA